jgi:CheY-like chemotaxis protein
MAPKAIVMSERQTVLVVEDDPLIREIMHDVLEDEGFHALCADSTRDAIATMEHEDGDDISAIFADIDLGDPGGGYEVARCARRIKPDIKIIYTSGGAREDFVRERVANAVFVAKPYHPSQVCHLLKRQLAG